MLSLEFMGFKQMLLLKILRKQGIMVRRGAKPKNRNQTFGEMIGSNG
jgi:hypothetical protein